MLIQLLTYLSHFKNKLIVRNLLKKLKVVQEVSNEERHKEGLKRLGKGYFQAYRINPLNPLSYILVVITILVIIVMYGFVGSYEKAMNPFKWN